MPSHTLHVVQAFEERMVASCPLNRKPAPPRLRPHEDADIFLATIRNQVNNVDFVRWIASWSSIVLTRIGLFRQDSLADWALRATAASSAI
jgi:hypothetical protein